MEYRYHTSRARIVRGDSPLKHNIAIPGTRWRGDISVEKTAGICYNTPKTDKRRTIYAAGSIS